MDIKELSMENKFYPDKLKHIVNPPSILHVLGDEEILNNECLTIIGSRHCTNTGAEIARTFARELARKRGYYC